MIAVTDGWSADPAETLIPKMRVGYDQAYLELYGQIDKGLLVFDDGRSTLGYFPVDNANASTRAGLRFFGAIDDDWSFGANLETEWTPYSTTDVNQLNHGDFNWDDHMLRKAEVYFIGSDFGRIWLGQGSMASDQTAEFDLSGTSVVGYSGLSDMAGGQLFRLEDGALSSLSVGSVFDNFDGLGRKLRARYDTPSLAGFTFGASVGTQVVPEETNVTVWDIAAKYENTLTDYKVAAGLAYSRPADDHSLVDGSISVLHLPTGLDFTLAGAYSEKESVDSLYAYAKLGYQADIFEVGKTAFSVDFYFGSDISADHAESRSIGAQFVQNLDYVQTELYLGSRLYSYNEASMSFDTGFAILAGARTRF